MALRLPDTALWTGREIVDWLVSLGLGVGWMTGVDGPDVPVKVGPYVDDEPDCLFVATATPGAGESLDGAGDVLGFQLRTRGPQMDPDGATRLAHMADQVIRFSDFPVDVALDHGSGLRLTRVMRSGGGPTVLPTDDSGDRTTLTCNYLTEIMR